MAEYDKNDLKSVLLYIRKEYGLVVLAQKEKLLEIFYKLAPTLKDDKIMLAHLAQLGFLENLVAVQNSNLENKINLIENIWNHLVKKELMNKL